MPLISLKVTIPKAKFALKKWKESLEKTQRRETFPGIKKLLQKTVVGWSEKPDFGYLQKTTSDTVEMVIFPKGPGAETWKLVNEGSPRHPIPRSGKKFMRFKKGYRAATTPGVLQSRRPYRSGPYWIANKVDHPGFPGRKFTKLAKEEYMPIFKREMQEAIRDAARRK